MADRAVNRAAEEKGGAPIRWGIIGAGRIAERFAASLAHDARAQLMAASGRTPGKVAAFAARYGISPERAYAQAPVGKSAPAGADVGAAAPVAPTAREADSAGAVCPSAEPAGTACAAAKAAGVTLCADPHARLLADPDIDAVYLALPHGLHLTWAVATLEAGKAVLCEKPAALTADEARQIAAAARRTGGLFMEGMKTRFVPLYAEVRRLLEAGAIGRVARVEASLCNDVPRASLEGTYLLDGAQGGALLDCGIYCASWIEDLLPGAFMASDRRRTDYRGVDAYSAAELSFFSPSAGEGECAGSAQDGEVPAAVPASPAATAFLECAFDRAKPRQAVLIGTAGRIVVDDLHRPQRMSVEIQGRDPQVVERPYKVDDFYGEIAHFNDLIDQGAQESPIMPLAASIRCAEILDAARG